MKFTAITLFALGASVSAYVVPDKRVVTAEKAMNAARMPVSPNRILITTVLSDSIKASGPMRVAHLAAALKARDPAPHHKGKGGAGRGGNNRRQAYDVEYDDAHWADLHTREAAAAEAVEIEARHHKGKGGAAKAGAKGAAGGN